MQTDRVGEQLTSKTSTDKHSIKQHSFIRFRKESEGERGEDQRKGSRRVIRVNEREVDEEAWRRDWWRS